MKRNSWKTLLSVVLLLAMFMSMLPFAAFAEDGQTAAAQTEEAAKTDEKTGDAPEGGTGGTPKDEGKADDAPKDEPNDANDDAARDENKDAHNDDTEQPAKGEAEGAAQAGTLQAQNEIKPLANPSATLIYNANGGAGTDYIYEKSGESGVAVVFFEAERIERFTPPENKEFSSWNTSTDGKGTTYNVGEPIMVRGGESLTLYAQWGDAAPKTVDITLTYDANGGTGTYSETKTFNVGEPYTFTVKSRSETGIDRAKHGFLCWSVDKDGNVGRYSSGSTITVTGDTTLYAQWQYVLQNISVLYYPNNNSPDGFEVERIKEGDRYTVKGKFSSFKTPYNKHFVNWNTEPDGSGATYEAGQVITAPGDDLTLCAQWADNPKWSELGIAISAPAKALPGADLTYAITVTNGTGYDLDSVTVDIALPAEVTYDESLASSGAWSLSYNSAARVVTARLESDDGSDVLALNGTAELNLPVTVTQDIFGTIEAKAKIAGASSRTGGKTGEGSSAAAQTTMAGLDISVTAPSSADIDQPFTYTVTVTNNTGVDLKSVHVYNTPPQGFDYSRQNDQDSLWSSVRGDDNRLFHIGGIQNGASAAYLVETKFTAGTAVTTAVNSAAITEIVTESNQTVTSGLPSDSAAVTLKEPDWSNLKIEKTVDKTAAGLGNTLTYTITVTNNTGCDLSYLCVEAPTPAGTSYPAGSQSSGSWFLSVHPDNSGVVAELRGGLAKGEHETFFMEVTADRDVPAGKVESAAKITKAESRSGYTLTDTHPNGLASNTVTTVIDPLFNLDIEVRALQPVAEVGEDHKFTYRVTVRNNGVWLDTAEITNILPTGVGAIVGTPDQHCKFSSDYSTVNIYGGFPKNESVSYTITTNFVPNGAATAVNTAEITSVTTERGNTYTGSKAAEAAVYSLAGLTVEKSVDQSTAKPGDTLSYTVKVTNNTDIDLDEVYVNDYLPGAVTYTDKDITTVSGGNLTFDLFTAGEVFVTIPGLKKGETAEYTVKATVSAGTSGEIESCASISSVVYDGGDPYTADTSINSNKVTTDVESGLTISVTADPAMANIYQRFTYTVTVYNGTGSYLKEVHVTDYLPTDVPPLSASKDENIKLSYDAQGIAWAKTVFAKISDLADGQSASFTVTVQFRYSNVTTAVNRAVITKVVTADNKTVTEGLGSVEKTTYSIAGLSIEKAFNETTARAGDTTEYTITVTNNTDIDLDELYVEDALPAEFAYVDSESVSGVWAIDPDSQPGIVAAALTGLKVKETAKFTVTVKVGDDASGTVASSASIARVKHGSDISGTNKKSSAEITVLTEVPVNVRVLFNGLEDVSQVPAGYKLTGADGNAFLKGEIGLLPAVKDNGVISRTFATTADVLLGQEYSLSFTQSGYEADGYDCTPEASYTVRQTPTADSKAINVEITLNYTKAEPKPVEMDAAVTVKFVGLDKDTKLPAYTLTGDKANEFLSGAIALTKDEAADTMVYTGKISAVPGKTYDLRFTQSGYNVDGYKCDAAAAVSETVTADAKSGVAVELVLNYSKINWGGLTITKTANKTHAAPGSYVKYTITVTNNTGVDLTNVNVLDYLPSTVHYSSSFGGYDSGTSSWTIAKLADGKSATATIRVKLNSGLSTGTAIENTAYITGVTINGQEHVFENLLLNSTAKVIVTDGKGAPQTGDESNLGLWIAVMAASLVCAGAATVIYKKRRG